MNALPWFRMYSRIMTDTDVEFLAFEDQRHYVWLLCMKNEGYLDKGYEGDRLDRVVARKLGLHGESLINCKIRLMEVGLINDEWQPRNWDELQFKSDSSKERVKKYRDKRRADQKTAVKRLCNVTVTAQDTDTDTDIKEKPKKDKKTLPPEYVDMVLRVHEETLPELTSVVNWKNTQKRATYLLKIYLDEAIETTSEDFWRAYFLHIRTNDWWMGRDVDANGKPKFKASFEFLVHPTQFLRIFEECIDIDKRRDAA